MISDPGNLDWPEEYIVMEKFSIEKRLYFSLNNGEGLKAKDKIKKHICITRVSIYLYANMILSEIESKSIMGLLERIRESFNIIYTVQTILIQMIFKEKL